MSNTDSRIIVSLDFSTAGEAVRVAKLLDPKLCRVKVGKQLVVAAGMSVVDRLHSHGFEVFLDLKFHDIPNTVAGAVRAAAERDAWMCNVHASGGRKMLCEAGRVREETGTKMKLIAVTVLTSQNQDDLKDTYGVDFDPGRALVEITESITPDGKCGD